VVLLATLVLLAVPAEEVPDFQIPTDVAFVVSGGYWTRGPLHGTYRLIVRNSGYEHVSSELVAEWIEDANGEDGPRMLDARRLIQRGSYSFEAPTIEVRGESLRVTLNGVVTHSPDRKVRCVFDLRPRGFDVIRACSANET